MYNQKILTSDSNTNPSLASPPPTEKKMFKHYSCLYAVLFFVTNIIIPTVLWYRYIVIIVTVGKLTKEKKETSTRLPVSRQIPIVPFTGFQFARYDSRTAGITSTVAPCTRGRQLVGLWSDGDGWVGARRRVCRV